MLLEIIQSVAGAEPVSRKSKVPKVWNAHTQSVKSFMLYHTHTTHYLLWVMNALSNTFIKLPLLYE